MHEAEKERKETLIEATNESYLPTEEDGKSKRRSEVKRQRYENLKVKIQQQMQQKYVLDTNSSADDGTPQPNMRMTGTFGSIRAASTPFPGRRIAKHVRQ